MSQKEIMHLKLFSLLSIILNLFLIQSVSLDLSGYNISSSFYVSSVAIFASRAFLALPRSSCYNNITHPTLIEASWFNELQPNFRKSYPFLLDYQNWNECDHLQDVISLDIEKIRSRLWILDRGNVQCFPKILIYNLFQKINFTLDVPEGTIGIKLNQLLVDDDFKLNGPRAYIGLDGESQLLVFSINEFKWWKVDLECPETALSISTKYMAFARKDSVLYFTGDTEIGIFSLDLSVMRQDFAEDTYKFNVTFEGEKLGPSSGLVSDFKDGLNYYMLRDFVIVRWNTKQPSVAENYNVLAQSYELLPYVSQLFTGPQNGIWALANPGDPSTCSSNPPQLTKRFVKILKYNILI